MTGTSTSKPTSPKRVSGLISARPWQLRSPRASSEGLVERFALRAPKAWKIWSPGTHTHEIHIIGFAYATIIAAQYSGHRHTSFSGLVLQVSLSLIIFVAHQALHTSRTTIFHDFQLYSSGIEIVRACQRRQNQFIASTVILQSSSTAAVAFIAYHIVRRDDSAPPWISVASIIPGIWLLLRHHSDHYAGLIQWTSVDRSIGELEAVQSSLHQDQSPSLRLAPMSVTLSHRDLLERIVASDFVISHQLVALGLRPETVEPIPDSWRMRVPAGSTVASEEVETHPDIVASNNALLSSLKLLIEVGLLRLDAGRLRVTLEGREAMAMPAALAISRLPAHIRAELARADLKFFARDYEGCATLCGTTLESFLKAAIRQLHADHGRRRKLLALHRIDDLDRATLGELATAISTYLDVPDGRQTGRSEERRQWLAASGFDASPLSGFDKDRRQGFVGLLGMCIDLRNEWLHHNPEFRGSHSRQVEDTYRLLHLTRIAISSFCAESGIDPFFVPKSREESSARSPPESGQDIDDADSSHG